MASPIWQRPKEVFQAALTRPPELRGAFLDEACGGDGELRRQVDQLLAAHDVAGDFLSSPLGLDAEDAGARATAPQRIGPYQILDTIAHGGMGSVYRAVRDDDAFHKTVALKLVRGGRHSDYFERRFRQERQILAGLQHPNIATVLDGGTAGDGQPYLVMEHVEGQPITEFCATHEVGTRERLALFRTVCGAVQYAHQNLVVHRDIKPANVLVDAHGVPKLLDFGIAKLLASGVEPDLAPTATVLPMMTPEYASPEQVRGQPVTTASDVYSLGVLLYELLAGRRPYEVQADSLEAIVQTVCQTEPRAPSEAATGRPATTRPGRPLPSASELRGDLDTIALKALRKEPERRYRTAHELSEDLRRHLEGLPVTARADTIGYRTGKFVRRHRAMVAAAFLLVSSLAAGVTMTLGQARRAEEQRARAERRFQDVRRLANSMVFELHDSIEDLPGATAARKLIVERALEYLDSLAQESRGDTSLQRELANAYRRIGDLQGAPYTSNVGDTPAALKSYERSSAIWQALLASNPGGLVEVIGCAELSRVTADALRSSGNSSAALEQAQRAVRTLEAARPLHPDDTGLLQELMRAYGAEASLHASLLVTSSLGDLSAALPLRRRQLEIAERLYAMAPSDQEAMRSLASAFTAMGDQLLMTGQRRQATEHFLRARQLLQELAGLSTSQASLHALHDNHYRMVTLHLADRDLGSARGAARQALDIGEQLVAADPQNAQAGLVLAADYANLGDVLSVAGRQEEARAALSKAMSIDSELVRRYPQTRQFRNLRYQRLLLGGVIFARQGSYARSLKSYREARDILRAMTASDPTNYGSRLPLAAACNGMGWVLSRLHDVEAASRAYHDALGLVGNAAEFGPWNEDAVYAVADAYAGLGEIELRRAAAARSGPTRVAHLREALVWTDRSLDQWRRVKEPGRLSPQGWYCTPAHEVRKRRARISAELSALDARVK